MNENIDSTHGNWRPGDLIDRVIADLDKLAKMNESELAHVRHRKVLRAYSLLAELMAKKGYADG